MSRTGWHLAGLALAGLLVATAASAHEARPAYLEIRETAPGRFSLLWRTPVLAGMRLPVRLQVPGELRNLQEPVVQELADSLVERRVVDAGPGGLAGRRIDFVGLPLTITDVLVHVTLLDGRSWSTIARPSQPWVEFAPPQSPIDVVGQYARHGIEHVVRGAEHLLFLLGLLLVARDARARLKVVSAALVAPSVTLALTTLGSVALPAAPLDAAIALGILFLGLEAVRVWRGETSVAIRHPWVIAFALGLLHGLGFASGLAAAALPRAELPLALLSFNLGLAIAQLAFVLLIVLGERAFRLLAGRGPGWLPAVPGYAVGSMGAFWTIQRVATLFGRGG
ncbi:MAG: HupE/UreJ family protein [Candidatus Binatia bacterium]